jgi:uracil-DNA glycosylase
MLWGGNARAKKSLISNHAHLVLESVHPSPLSAFAGFFGCGHFARANEFFKLMDIDPIKWERINE